MNPEQIEEWTPYKIAEFKRKFPSSYPRLQYRLDMAVLARKRAQERIDELSSVKRARVLARFTFNRDRHVTVMLKMLRSRHRIKPFATHTPGMSKRIIALASEAAGCRVSDIISMSRVRTVSTARQAAAYVIDRHCGLSSTDIGRRLGGRDHSTILHAFDVVNKDLTNGGERFGAIVQYIEDRLALRAG